MQINNLTNCNKPKHFGNFKGKPNPDSTTQKLRYKRYEEVIGNDLYISSIIKAHEQVKSSNKMRMLKVIPGLTAATIGISTAIIQPGKLSTKVGTGLAFLALYEASKKAMDIYKSVIKSKEENQKDKKPSYIKEALLTTGAFIASTAGVVSIAKKAGDSTKVGKFIKKEAATLANEINSTKLAGYVDKTVEPFLNKHASKANIAAIIGAMGVLAGSKSAYSALINSVNRDIKLNAMNNYRQAKASQQAENIED